MKQNVLKANFKCLLDSSIKVHEIVFKLHFRAFSLIGEKSF